MIHRNRFETAPNLTDGYKVKFPGKYNKKNC